MIRTFLFVAAVVIYFFDSDLLDFTANPQNALGGVFLFACWGMLVIGMLYRIFPNTRISVGARRHFEPVTGKPVPAFLLKKLNFKAIRMGTIWFVFNASLFMVLHNFGVFTPALAVLITLFYALCDVVFIMFWCPFQRFFMHNRCCTECRIYNWDYVMMVTPLVLFPGIFTVVLILMAGFVFVRWEIAARRNPWPFLQYADKPSSCTDCEDKLCHFKGRDIF